MIASWMMYSLVVGALLAAAAWMLEEVCRLARLPVRWVWIAALAGTLAMLVIAPFRAPPPSVALPVTLGTVTQAAVARDDGMAMRFTAAMASARAALNRLPRAAASLAVPGPALAGGWAAVSLVLLAIGGATLRRARRARSQWPLREVDGTPVRVAPGVGPAVLGVRSPEVVVPGWLLEAPADEQRLVVMHEREHIAARDPLLLAVGCVAAALVPWNPAAWWMLRRLRQAVELDCDARVLRGGARPGVYGSLLIDMAGRGPGLSLGAPALAGSPSSLQRRLRAMNVRLPRFAPARAGFLGVLGAAVLAGACQADLPTSAEMDRMDASTAAEQATRFQMISSEGMTFEVNGKAVPESAARLIPADQIGGVEMRRNENGTGIIAITTVGNSGPMRVGNVRLQAGAPGDTTRRLSFTVRSTEGTEIRHEGGPGMGERFEGLVVIDGQIVDNSVMRTLNPDRIASINVIKGAAATNQYSDPRAAKGVISIVLKPANP